MINEALGLSARRVAVGLATATDRVRIRRSVINELRDFIPRNGTDAFLELFINFNGGTTIYQTRGIDRDLVDKSGLIAFRFDCREELKDNGTLFLWQTSREHRANIIGKRVFETLRKVSQISEEKISACMMSGINELCEQI